MKKNLQLGLASVLLMALFLTSCQKDNSQTATAAQLSAATLQAALSTGAIAVSSTGSSRSAADSIYVVNTCSKGSHLIAITDKSLPASATGYLTANYGGYTFKKAFTVDSAGTTKGYVVVIEFNNKPVGLKFDVNGNFVQVLEQREGHDLDNHGGYHDGGIFDDRGGSHKDSVSLNALPASIKTYFAATYPTDTLVRAFKNRDNSIVVLSSNNGIYATVFSDAGVFIKRVQLPAHSGKAASIGQGDLPAAIQSYLTSAYPNYVFKLAFAVRVNGVIQGYVVFIDANNTKYGVEFDASGNFVRAVTVR